MANITVEFEAITAALKEQLGRDADSVTLIITLFSFARAIARHASSQATRAAANGLTVRMRSLSLSYHVPRFVVRDMLDDFIREIESQARLPSV